MRKRKQPQQERKDGFRKDILLFKIWIRATGFQAIEIGSAFIDFIQRDKKTERERERERGIYIYIYIRGASNKFPAFFCTGIWNRRRLLKIHHVIAVHRMRWLTNFYDFRFKSTATAVIGIHPTKPDFHSWWISKMQSGREDTLEEQNAIKFCFKLAKMPQKCMEWFRLLLEHLARIEHQFLNGIRDSRKAGSLWGMMRGVRRVRKSIHHSWLAKGLGLGLVCWGFKGVQEESPLEEASTLQIGSVAFPLGQCTSP